MDLSEALAIMARKEHETGYRFELVIFLGRPCLRIWERDKGETFKVQVLIGPMENMYFEETIDYLIKSLTQPEEGDENERRD